MEPGFALGALPAVAFGLALVSEMLAPARPGAGIEGRRWALNLALFAVNAGAVALVALALQHLAPLAAEPPRALTATLVAFLFLDLAGYLLHRLHHRFRWLWRFHRLHHSDHDLDATTSLRHHVVEACGTFAALGLLAWLFGIDAGTFALYGTVLLSAQILQHANVAWPAPLERLVGLLFVTPGFHEVHHIDDPAYYDRNFGMLLSVWDRLFGTARRRDPGPVHFGAGAGGQARRARSSAFTST